MTHCRSVSLKFSAVLIVGRATLTMAMSSTTMNWTSAQEEQRDPLTVLGLEA